MLEGYIGDDDSLKGWGRAIYEDGTVQVGFFKNSVF